MHHITLEELLQRRTKSMLGSEQAIRQQTDTYRMLKQMVDQINGNPLDVGDYYHTALRLSALLGQMTRGGEDTIFHYFAEQIDPGKYGDVRCFRMECRDLAEQIKAIDQWRAARRRLKRIK